MRKFIVTGAAGFIGSSLVHKLLDNGYEVLGIDNINSYYDRKLKLRRLELIEEKNNLIGGSWRFVNLDIENLIYLDEVFSNFLPEVVINLAAQAGVRYSLENPKSYAYTNLIGFFNVLDSCKKYGVKHFLYASSSSVYGANKRLPFSEKDNVDNQVSFYAATKRANEIMAQSYSSLYKISITGLRFFTVYGPWGRPDMAPMIFAKSIMQNEEIDIYNYGKMQRDFTFIEDVSECVVRCSLKKPFINENLDLKSSYQSNTAPHKILNIGNGKGVDLIYFIELLEESLKKKAKKNFVSMQKGDVTSTLADTNSLYEWISYKPLISIEEGVKKFAKWYESYFN